MVYFNLDREYLDLTNSGKVQLRTPVVSNDRPVLCWYFSDHVLYTAVLFPANL